MEDFITLHQRFGGGKPIYVRPSHICAIWESSMYDIDSIILVNNTTYEVKESPEEVRALASCRSLAE